MRKFIICIVLVSFTCFEYAYPQAAKQGKSSQYERIYQPDSQLTPKELKLKYRIYDLIVKNILCDGKKVYTNLTVDDFKNNDIPVFYYKEFIKSLSDINKFFDSNEHCKPGDLQKAIDTLKKQYKIVRESSSKK